MRNGNLKRWSCCVAALLVILAGSANFALAAGKGEPDPTTNQALATLMKNGAKFHYLGRYADLDGWMVEKDGKIQIIYKSSKNTYAVVGYLFAPNGENITGEQVRKLTANNKELAALAGATPPPAAVPAAAPAPEAAPVKPVETEEQKKDASLSPGERLFKQLQNTPNVLVGANPTAPIIDMLVLPSVPACLTSWTKISPLVHQGDLRVRLFPAGLKGSEDERISAQLLATTAPLDAWDQFAGGDAIALAGAAPQPALDKVATITALVNAWSFPTAPYFIYRAKSGQMKVVQGAPVDVKAMVDDAAPETNGPAKP